MEESKPKELAKPPTEDSELSRARRIASTENKTRAGETIEQARERLTPKSGASPSQPASPAQAAPVTQTPPPEPQAKIKKPKRPLSKTVAAANRVDRALDGLNSSEKVLVLRFCLEQAATENQKEAYEILRTAQAGSQPQVMQMRNVRQENNG